MPKFRKKPVVIEAFQFNGQSNTEPSGPDWFAEAVLGRVAVARPDHLIIHTLEGQHRADLGDWIIQGIKGELYPCKPDIFEATYEAVELPLRDTQASVPCDPNSATK